MGRWKPEDVIAHVHRLANTTGAEYEMERKKFEDRCIDYTHTLLERNRELQILADRAAVYVNDTLPQAKVLAFQDYDNLNELCMALTKLSSIDKETRRYG